jgi:hypothetical protein
MKDKVRDPFKANATKLENLIHMRTELKLPIFNSVCNQTMVGFV